MSLNSSLRAAVEKPTVDQLPFGRPNASAARSLAGSFGSNCNDPALRASHHRRQVLASEFKGQLPPAYEKTFVRDHGEHPDFSGATLALQQNLFNCTLASHNPSAVASSASDAAGPVAEKVLRFFAFFLEECKESPVERRRVRKVAVKAFPQDNTFLVEEKRVHNSGLQGGTILKRQRVVDTTATTGDSYVCVTDLNVGAATTLFGTVYRIYACDESTRLYLEAQGINVPENSPEPDDHYVTNYRATRIEGRRHGPSFEDRDLAITVESLSSKGKAASRYPDDTLRSKRFFEESGKVARFSAYWLDREVDPEGRLRVFEVRCFIEDNTISVTEHHAEGTPCDEIPKCFLSRRRLPKSGSAAKSVSLTFAGRVNGQREVALGKEDSYYDVCDLSIGMDINVFGRCLSLYDCDPFTREYFTSVLGIRLGDAIDISSLFPKPVTRPVMLPPPTGFGTPEDSIASCKSLVLKPPRKDTSGWLEFGGESLHFEMRLQPSEADLAVGGGDAANRRFVLSYFLEDNEMMITESAVRNTGFTGGKFLRKQKIRKAPGEGAASFYSLDDIRVGCSINVNGFAFEILRCDDHTAAFLSQRQDRTSATTAPGVPRERVQQILNALREFVSVRFCTITEAFRCFDKDKDGYVCASELAEMLSTNQITRKPEEASAVMAALDGSQAGRLSYAAFVQGVSKSRIEAEVVLPTVVSGEHSPAAVQADANAAARRVQRKTLLALRNKLEARCMNTFEMFRMFSLLPRQAASGTSSAIAGSGGNGARDTVMTPSQLRKGITEILGLILTDGEMGTVLRFFFEALTAADVGSVREASAVYGIGLNDFSAKLLAVHAMSQIQ